MRTDTISRDDIQDTEITIIKQQMVSNQVVISNANESISHIKASLKEMVRTGDENFEYFDKAIRALTDNQKLLSKRQLEADAKIEDLSSRVIQLTVILYALVVAVFVGVIVYARFFA